MTGRLPLAAALLASALFAAPALATPALVVDLDSGDILHQQEATRSWFPASITKLMTAYVALDAVRNGRLTLDTPMIVSKRAAGMAPSKMGFRPGSEVTLDNALKIIMVKSANDVSVTIAEGVGGSVEGFAALMNSASAKLGMTNSHWVNPNGLPNAAQVTSARDMAILARALHREFPEHRDLWGIGAIQFGGRYMGNHNGLIGRYPGADGMKTGFTCAAGFNVVATASRGGRRLIAVVLGEPSASERTAKAAQLFDRGFSGRGGGGNLSGLGGDGIGAAPNMRGVACVRRSRGGGWIGEEEDLSVPLGGMEQAVSNNPALETILIAAGQNKTQPGPAGGRAVAARPKPRFEPILVTLGRAPGWSGPAVGPGAGAQSVAVAAAPRGRGKAAPAGEGAVETTAFAPPKPRVLDGSQAPLAADPAALPLRLTGAAADAPAHGKAAAKAKHGKARAVANAKTVGKPLAGKPATGKARAAAAATGKPVAARAKPAAE